MERYDRPKPHLLHANHGTAGSDGNEVDRRLRLPGESVLAHQTGSRYISTRTRTTSCYNIREDISKQHDLPKNPMPKHKKIEATLTKKLSDHLRRNGADMPVRRPTGQRATYPDEVL